MSLAQINPAASPADAMGVLLWFAFGGSVEYVDGKRTVMPVSVNVEDLYAWFAELGLDESHLPPQVRRIDKFRAVTSAARRRYDVTGGRAELYVEEVQFDVNQVVRNVLRRVTDARRNTTVDHVATLKFIRGGRSNKARRTTGDHYRAAILTKVLEPDRSEIEQFLADINTAYLDGADTLDPTALRSVVRRYLLALNGVQLRSSGGIYFVPASTADVVPALAEVIRRIDSSGCSLDYIDMEVNERNVAVVTQAMQTAIVEECEALSRAIDVRQAAAQSKGKLSPAHYAEFKGRLDEILATAVVYTAELGLPLGVAGDALDAVEAKRAEALNPLALRT
jgi:hypothetical protein